ncbi:uncharacterized protein DUF4169 [Mesorhizobium sp. J18]|uniref:DUF4169 family protein n=1 Tax=Mesorhizobium sp. J18 TaxID=935263 RepID=UPI00119921E1|nr:DUF4169 family protein [Mesorhizobium sp. J18]TWH01070.1 uncharacterized protein DUF4169 [Mesorhizobium sp. J18]
MGEVVNLRMIRKRKQRMEKEQLAAENRRKHGLLRAERDRQRMVEEQANHILDLHRREKPAADGNDASGGS